MRLRLSGVEGSYRPPLLLHGYAEPRQGVEVPGWLREENLIRRSGGMNISLVDVNEYEEVVEVWEEPLCDAVNSGAPDRI